MDTRERGTGEVAIPASALAALQRAMEAEAGALSAIHGMHAAGYEAGSAVFDGFARGHPGGVGETPERTFWSALGRFLERRGWGSLRHSSPHPGVGLLVSPDWAEAEGDRQPGSACAFSTGLLAHVLTRTVQRPVAVLEVSCRARGDEDCSFAFGSETTIHDLYGLLLEGMDLDRALAEL